MVKIAHIADVHIRNLKFHDVYRECFSNLYKSLKEENVDIIYIAGDLAHTKTELSPEYFELCSEFLDNLSDIASTYVILGNHDGNLRSLVRQDAVTPVVKALDYDCICLLKNSVEVEVSPGVVFNCLSVFDRENWIKPSDPTKINIALYHGSISGCITDTGWIIRKADEDIDIFSAFDYAMLGDIHKSNQVMDRGGKIRYAGSLIQQNHGETNDKGYLLWTISGKDDFKVEHIQIDNPSPYVTLILNDEGMVDDYHDIPEGCKLRVVSNISLSLEEREIATEDAKFIYSPDSITFLNRAGKYESDLRELSSRTYKENLRDLKIQNELIEEYLEEFELTDEEMLEIFELNKKYNSQVEEDEDICRNINWELKSLEWDNLFNYGVGNRIDFDLLEGIVGIFGKNFSGKSSIIDSLLFTIFNTTSKNERKNVNIINNKKERGCGAVEIQVGNKTFIIEREAEKYIKKIKGKETEEAKTNVNFYIKEAKGNTLVELDGVSRGDTDKKIRKRLGTFEDFLFTSLTSQHGALNFIEEGSTKRKELLAKFLDLEIFDQKFKLAKEDSLYYKMNIKRFKDANFVEEIKELKEEIRKKENQANQTKVRHEALGEKLSSLKVELEGIKAEIEATPSKIIDIHTLQGGLSRNLEKIGSLSHDCEKMTAQLSEDQELSEKISSLLGQVDIEQYREKQAEIKLRQKNINFLIGELNSLGKKIKVATRKSVLLSEVPCGEQFSGCKFIRDAFRERDSIPELDKEYQLKLTKKEVLEQEVESLEPKKILERIRNCEKILERKNKVETSIQEKNLILEKNRAIISNLKTKNEEMEKQKEEYCRSKEAIENLKVLVGKEVSLQSQKAEIGRDLKVCNSATMGLYKEKGSLEQKLQTVLDQKKEYETANSNFKTYEMFMRCTHSCGISYDIIKKKLPIINNEISKILENIVEFKAYFEENGRQLNIFIKHPEQKPRPISLGSGAEKTIAAMAIRLALLSISSLPKSNILILDEPGTALDEENMEGFTRMLGYMKNYFKTILMISHLDSLKDCADHQIVIENVDGHANVVI